MYAVITTGGKQYKVEENKDIVVERIEGKEGDKIKLPEVNMVSDGDKVEIGSPNIEKAIVEATIKKQFKGDKVIAFKFKAKKRYKRKVGHRQLLTLLHLEKISTK
ncbi:MAG: 50S ribosomal protein L21 [Actinobacteria bacterium]|nr:50S ribosomal protein L21 [Actinomycetota bacterium]MBE3094859.1 50S ribosomal protein L21 [Actinomycetota bacterium]